MATAWFWAGILIAASGVLAGSSPFQRIAASGPPAAPVHQARTTVTEASSKKESPFACNAGALDAEQRKRWMALARGLIASNQEVRELEDGYAFRFSPATANLRDISEWIGYERLCCPFFDFELKLEREGGPLWLALRGREGVKPFIKSEFRL